MTGRLSTWIVGLLIAGIFFTTATSPVCANETPLPSKSLPNRLTQWLDKKSVDDSVRKQIDAIWKTEPNCPMTVLEKTLRSIALVDPQYEPWVNAPTSSDLAKTETADQTGTDFPSAHLRLWTARALIQEHRFDEAQKLLDGLEPEQVVDPATLWFSQAIVSHQLLKKEVCLEAIESLLADTTECPRRYRALAERMRSEMKNLKVDDLDHIARRMNEIRRRLELGQTDPKVRRIEDGVIESLDKMIENLEQQQKQQQQASASSSQSLRSSRPAEESMPAGGKGPGRVTQKTFDGKSDWGNLPPKERKKTLQQIGREFPSHYQEIIEQYFRRQATEEETP